MAFRLFGRPTPSRKNDGRQSRERERKGGGGCGGDSTGLASRSSGNVHRNYFMPHDSGRERRERVVVVIVYGLAG